MAVINFAQMIKDQLTCHEFFRSVGVHIDRCGKVKCPFHGEKTASLKVYDDPQRGWHCFGCGSGGSVIDLAMMWYGEGYTVTVQRLNDDFNLGLPMDRKLSPKECRAMDEERKRKNAEREALKQRVREAENAYLDAHFAWMENERIIEAEAPKGHLSEPSEKWFDAKMRQAELKHEMECAEERWWKIRDEQRRSE